MCRVRKVLSTTLCSAGPGTPFDLENSQSFLVLVQTVETYGLDRSRQLFKKTHKTGHALTGFAYSIRKSASQDNFLFGVKCLFDGVGASSSILKEYWRSLLESKDPGVNEELIKEAFRSLEFWSDRLFLANVNFILETSNRDWL
ncbi:hypothetical protein H4Q26_002937 [Puccinia striiformis f. sp. tritici PST-130]|uniref:Uncharacterized protein n=1 Tax=Puccinia striiformis f. sp. tritici PST-78 TaxID=1165861 RepID=A0A0L0V3L2_9BASI|nr:hypothetical protein H4Q26_002937 [Puccinia striiformis f. sp. tritici PST-130]KNE93549.1 hypothetical protein PSTG_13082 [Puccinia striiformis f. sp. tritici PST-78]